MTERISCQIKDGVADVKLARPEKMNALDDAMFDALVSTGESLAMHDDVRCVVLSGIGKAFCAGIDMGRLGSLTGGSDAPGDGGSARYDLTARSHGIANRAQRAATVWRDLPVPVIAAVHGVAFGGGLQVALGADVRLIAADTRLSVMEVKWGLVPDMAGIALMRELVRDDVIRELTYTARIFSGTEAVALGFATRVESDPYQAAHVVAREIAQKSPSAIEAAKRLLNAAADQTLEQTLMQESVEQQSVIGQPNQIEAVRSQMEKRPAKFVSPRATQQAEK